VESEGVVREPCGKPVEIRQVDLAQITQHGAILTMVPDWVKNGGQGA
jgi:hypothetical protein